MFNLARAVLTAAILAASPCAGVSDTLNLLVMGEDSDPDTIERHTPIFDRVVQAISGELRGRDLAVYDETAVTMEFYDLGRVRRPDAELISLAKSVQIVPIDAVTAFEIYAATMPSPYEGITDFRLRISGRVINVVTGQSLGGYEVSYRPGDLPQLPLNCHRDCQIAFVGDHAARIAEDVGAALAAQLAHLARASGAGETAPIAAEPACEGQLNAFTIAFKGFSDQDMSRIDSFLAIFQGYVQHVPLAADAAHHDYRYETCSDAARLERNLRAMFEQTGMDVWLEADDHGFAAAKMGGE